MKNQEIEVVYDTGRVNDTVADFQRRHIHSFDREFDPTEIKCFGVLTFPLWGFATDFINPEWITSKSVKHIKSTP